VSYDWIRWAMETAGGSSADRFVLWVVAAHADGATGEAFPSVARIAELTGLHQATIVRSIEHLRTAGLLALSRGGRGPGDVSRYFLGEQGSHQATLFDGLRCPLPE
jgi:pyocin large subunit-like protein